MPDIVCPICRQMYGGKCRLLPSTFDGSAFDCDMCGPFKAVGTSLATRLGDDTAQLSPIQRAALAHRVRSAKDAGGEPPLITSDWLERFLQNARLPSPSEQAIGIIRLIGENVENTGKPLRQLPPHLWTSIGSPNPPFALNIAFELHTKGLVAGAPHPPDAFPSANLTLAGWERYEAEKRGKIAGNYGFIALKFGDTLLDPFIGDVVKPCVKAELGFDVVDMRDISQAGVIDNIMRAQIRDAAFVLVDLTHDNSGAYWEAGYAEGLGKPVLYLCEKSKFDQAKTHFDTNHCTTVLWSSDGHEEFSKQLVATLRRSLNLFPRR
jgi:nucleoside 2-deoxyribosyltransferase